MFFDNYYRYEKMYEIEEKKEPTIFIDLGIGDFATEVIICELTEENARLKKVCGELSAKNHKLKKKLHYKQSNQARSLYEKDQCIIKLKEELRRWKIDCLKNGSQADMLADLLGVKRRGRKPSKPRIRWE